MSIAVIASSRGTRQHGSRERSSVVNEASEGEESVSRESQKSSIKSSSVTVSFRGPKAFIFSDVIHLSRYLAGYDLSCSVFLDKAAASRCFTRYCAIHARLCSD